MTPADAIPTSTPPVSDKELAKAIEGLPPVSPVLQRLLAVLADPNSDLDDIGRLVRSDTALTTRILRLANSAAYALSERVSSIEDAVQQIGVVEVNRLVTSLGTRQFIDQQLHCYDISASFLWQHAITVAVASEVIADHLHVDRGTAYVTGILHPIGFVALNKVGENRKLLKRTHDIPLLDWEREHFGMDNSGAAARAMRHWKFPAELADIIAARYEAPMENQNLRATAVLHLASCMAEHMVGGLPPEGGLFRISASVLDPVGITREQWADLENEARQSLARTRTLLKLA